MESRKKTILYIVLGLLVLVVGGLAGWFLRKNSDKSVAYTPPPSFMELGKLPIYNSANMVGNPISNDPSNAAQNIVTSLRGKTGAEFDKAYLTQATVLTTLSNFAAQMAISRSKDPAIIAVAKNIAADVDKESKALQALQKPTN